MMKQTAILVGLAILAVGCGHRQTYAEGCGALPTGWITPREGRSVMSFVNTASVAADGTLSWNGVKISKPTFAAYLKQTSEMNPVPDTHIKFDPAADCGTVASVRRVMASTLDCSGGKCAEGSGKWWLVGDVIFDGKPPEPYDPEASPKP